MLINLSLGCVCRRSQESECTTNLRAWHTAERSWHTERGVYSTDFGEIGFAPEFGNRYLYTDDPLGRFAPRATRNYPSAGMMPERVEFQPVTFADVPARVAGGQRVGLTGTCPDCEIAAVCVAQLDDDEEVDVWSISTAPRIDERTGEEIPAGIPFHDRADRHPRQSVAERWFR